MTGQYLPDEIALQAINLMKEAASQTVAKIQRRFFKESKNIEILGLRTAQIRSIDAEIFKLVKDHWGIPKVIDLSETLLMNRYLEAKLLSTIFMQHYKEKFGIDFIKIAYRWLLNNYCDNWAVVDSLCTQIIPVIMERFSEIIPAISNWSVSRNMWVRRASVVSFVKHARKGKEIETVHSIAKTLFSDKNDLIQKALGWLLRESGKTDMKRLRGFLIEHGKRIPRTTVRYAIEKFPENERKELLEVTRG